MKFYIEKKVELRLLQKVKSRLHMVLLRELYLFYRFFYVFQIIHKIENSKYP